MTRAPLPTLALVLLALGTGCATKRPFSDADAASNAITDGTPPQVSTWLKGLRPATGPATAGELLALEPVERRFQWTLNGESREVIYRIDTVSNAPTAFTISWIDAKGGSLISLQRVFTTPEGSVVSRSSINSDRAVESRFNPPLTILEATLSPGSPHKSEHDVLVSDVDRPGRVTHRGRATSTVELVGTNTVTTGDHESRCVVVRTSFDATFGPAVVKRISYQWYEPGRGLVAEYADERVRTLGVETDARREFWVAVD